MEYSKFLADLFEDGRVMVDPISPLDDEQLAAGDQCIADYERRVRLEAPANAPPHDPHASRWAAQRFHRACQLCVYRDYDQTTVERELDVPFDQPATPSIHYSVDLVFRFLPDLAKFASSAAENDPLLDYLKMWARNWPLSSIGMRGVSEVDLHVLGGDKSLLQIYADRVVAADDRSRLSEPAVRDAIRRAIGPFRELAPQIAKAIQEQHSVGDDGDDNAPIENASEDDFNHDKTSA